MKDYDEIREEELIGTKDYSDKKLNRYIRMSKFVKWAYSERFFWVVSVIPLFVIPFLFHISGALPLTPIIALIFVATHFLYWHFHGRKDVRKMIEDIMPEIDMTIKVLEEIRKERNGNK